MADCNNCVNKKLPSYSATCVECGLSRKNFKPITNADRIRAMTDEELAEWINKHNCYTNLYGYDPKDAILDWLKQEATE